MSARRWITATFAAILALVSEAAGLRFLTTTLAWVTLFLGTRVLAALLPQARAERLRRGGNIFVAVMLWVGFLVAATSSLVPRDVLAASALMGVLWLVFDRPEDRLIDTLYGGLVSLIAVVGVAFVGDGPTSGLVAGLAGIGLVSAFGALDLRRVQEDLHARSTPLRHRRLDVLLLLAFAGLMSFIPPVAPTSLNVDAVGREARGTRESVAMTGFSSTLRLGEFQHLKFDDREVMRVRFGEASGPDWTHEDGERSDRPKLLMRGLILDHFDGRGFSSKPGRADGERGLRHVALVPRMRVRQDVEILGYDGATLFGIAPVVAWEGDVDSSDWGVLQRRGPAARFYRVVSEPLAPDRGPSTPDYGHEDPRYVQLPKLAARVESLVGKLAREGDPVAAVTDWLAAANGFRYTRRDPNLGDDPLARFLVETKAGHCEYYAAGMVVLLRALGVPSRVAVGFRGGTYSRALGVHRVLAKNAHAWVEVSDRNLGWITLDPTPSEVALDSAGVEERVAPIDGRSLAQASNPSAAAASELQRVLRSRSGGLMIVLVAALLVGFGIYALRRRGFRSAPHELVDRGVLAPAQRFSRLLARAGAPDVRSATLLERIDRSSLRDADQHLASDVAMRLYAWRFGGRILDDSARRDWMLDLAELERAVERIRSRT